jgi:predicted metal-dependent phosphoesterase TrpH
MLIDLHIHTNISDGELSPKEIIDEAVNNKASIISITDHDTIDAYTDDLIKYANNNKIDLIPGVEISTKSHGVGIHILGYNIDIHSNILKKQLEDLRNIRHEYLYNVGKKLKELGYEIDIEELDKIHAVTKAHISLQIINNLNNKEKLLKEFGHIPNKGEFIENIMNENCPAYVKKRSITPLEAANIIRKAGGKVVLAHPVAYEHQDNLTDLDIQEIIEEIIPDGIEANYIFYDRDENRYNESEKWKKVAKKNNLFTTIGSDFHTKSSKHALIGLINENIHISDEEINNIINLLK